MNGASGPSRSPCSRSWRPRTSCRSSCSSTTSWRGGLKAGGHQLILPAVVIWLTNVVVFALWFWEIDRGGPDRRARDPDAPADFWFPHMSEPAAHPGWAPNFVDYLYLSYTNSTALSPTDTMPMTTRVKLLMMGQSITSLITVLLVASRAVNILH
jgi:uncharacterized membrane protein